jgi:hypothetical protein
MHITQNQMIKLAVALYVVLSFAYILLTGWNNFKTNYAQRAYAEGQAATVNQVIQQAESSNCQPFAVYNEEKQIQLINVTCLEGQNADAAKKEAAPAQPAQ